MRMKQIMKLGLGIGMTAVLLSASASAEAEVRVGGVSGIALSSLSTDEKGVQLGTLTSWSVGGVLELDLSPTMALASRPIYVGRGAAIKALPGLGDISDHGKNSYARNELSFIELPLLIKCSLSAGDIRPYLIAGPSLGLLQKAEGVSRFGSAAEERENIKKDFKSADIGINAGAGIGANLGGAYVFAEGLYGYGLTRINKDTTEGTAKNRGMQLRAGVTLRLGSR